MAGRIAAGAGISPPLKTGDATASPASLMAAEIKRLVTSGERDEARERFGALPGLVMIDGAKSSSTGTICRSTCGSRAFS